MLDLRRLRYFIEIVDRGSISAAARSLNVAQPALSHHVAQLERLLGAPVLVRLPRGIRLTEAGHILLRHARVIAADVEMAERELRETIGRSPSPQVVHLALIPSLSVNLAPALLARTALQLPEVRLHIVEGITATNHELIASGKLDLAVNLSDGDSDDGDLLIEEPLFHVAAAAVSSGAGPMHFAEMASGRLLMPSAPNPLRQLLDRVARQAGVTLEIMDLDGLNTLKRAVAAGIGGSVLSWLAVKDECVAGALVARRIVNPSFKRFVVLERSPGVDHEIAETIRQTLVDVLEKALERAPAP